MRAAAIDVLADTITKEEIPIRIEVLAGGAGIRGADQLVGARAANALSAAPGRPVSIDQKEWQR